MHPSKRYIVSEPSLDDKVAELQMAMDKTEYSLGDMHRLIAELHQIIETQANRLQQVEELGRIVAIQSERLHQSEDLNRSIVAQLNRLQHVDVLDRTVAVQTERLQRAEEDLQKQFKESQHVRGAIYTLQNGLGNTYKTSTELQASVASVREQLKAACGELRSSTIPSTLATSTFQTQLHKFETMLETQSKTLAAMQASITHLDDRVTPLETNGTDVRATLSEVQTKLASLDATEHANVRDISLTTSALHQKMVSLEKLCVRHEATLTWKSSRCPPCGPLDIELVCKFLANRTHIEAGATIHIRLLFEAFESFCHTINDKVLTKTQFLSAMRSLKVDRVGSGASLIYRNIKLKQ